MDAGDLKYSLLKQRLIRKLHYGKALTNGEQYGINAPELTQNKDVYPSSKALLV
jgi:hypothetical protein